MHQLVKIFLVSLFLCLIASVPAAAQAREPETIPLWPDGAPGAVGSEDADIPTLTLYPADPGRNTGAAVVICPGGGYAMLAIDHEGHQIAKWFNSIGVSAFIVRYRLGMRYHHPAPLLDVQRAIRYVRNGAPAWGVREDRIGVMGFSAGGHLASTAGTHFDTGNAGAQDPVDRASSRPDFMILVYPVISLTAPFTHQGSKRHLLGEEPDPALVELLSNELQVTAETPPTFLVHADDDRGVPPENAVVFYLALRKAGVSSELHIYRKGGHGFGLAPLDAILGSWPGRLRDWLLGMGYLGR